MAGHAQKYGRFARAVVAASAAALMLGGCRSAGLPRFPGGHLSPAPATVPAQLIGESAAPASGVAPAATASCRNPLFDPTDNTPLTLTGSGMIDGVQQGDYAVPAGRYGLPSGSRLRVDCATGRVRGVVTP